jgi:hypothetical protein
MEYKLKKVEVAVKLVAAIASVPMLSNRCPHGPRQLVCLLQARLEWG